MAATSLGENHPDTFSARLARTPGCCFDALVLSRLLILLVLIYRGTLGLFLGGFCRYQPTCSQYMIDAIRKHGPWRGTWRGLRRILRCHPWGGSGYDPA